MSFWPARFLQPAQGHQTTCLGRPLQLSDIALDAVVDGQYETSGREIKYGFWDHGTEFGGLLLSCQAGSGIISGSLSTYREEFEGDDYLSRAPIRTPLTIGTGRNALELAGETWPTELNPGDAMTSFDFPVPDDIDGVLFFARSIERNGGHRK